MLKRFLILGLVWAGFTTAEAVTGPRNVVLIMADDIGIECFGSYGGTSYKTPNIDGLAETGLRFTHAYSQPLGTPARLQIMTGRDNHRNWQYFGILPPGERTFGHLMQERGFKTGLAGKWKLQSYDPPDFPGAEERRGTGMHPKDARFDRYALFHALHPEDKGSRYADPTYLQDGTLHKELKGKYGEDLSGHFHFGLHGREQKQADVLVVSDGSSALAHESAPEFGSVEGSLEALHEMMEPPLWHAAKVEVDSFGKPVKK